ncbi:MAG: prolipoprotein diacylglyceryl transferase [Planctomycetota bacterium]|jgi:phosphatidylglycerol:prolipoprotein diacylglycerol transferase
MNWWNHIPEHINPNIVEIGSFQIRYYGIMYIIAFAVIYLLVLGRLKNERYEYSKAVIQKYFVWTILGVLIGGRLGYVLFYDFMYFIAHPLGIICPFDYSNGFSYTGLLGMSYHGGLLGAILASLLFCYKNRINFWCFADLITPAIPLGYTFGRLGNFFNGELYGRVTSVPWGMYFPLDTTGQLRHPSQLYEAFFEGIFLFIILWSVRKKRLFDGFHFCLYIISYGIVRFCIEFVREPDLGLEYIWHFFTMGQLLSISMILIGIFIFSIKLRT